MRSLFVAALLLCAPLVAQVRIVDARWGFDGSQTVGEFNLLSVTVRNESRKPFRGEISLAFGNLARMGAARSRPCFLSPGSVKTVRFYPFVLDTGDAWTVSVGRDSVSFSMWESENKRRLLPGEPATVLLQRRDALTTRSVGLRVFADEDFPGTVAATGGLARVVLDHVPRFQGVQVTAFLDWLRGGGELHLMHGASGPLKLEGPLAFLSADARAEFRVGAGRVIKHPRRLQKKDPLARFARKRSGDSDWTGNATGTLNSLAEIVRADHDWASLYFILFGFAVLVVPVHAWLSFKKVHYLASIGILLGVVALGTYAIFEVGRRGHGETSAVHSISYAKQLEPGRFDVFQYKNLFSTTSTDQKIRHQARGSLYSSGRFTERVPGRIFHEADPRFVVHVPLFTSRAFLHRGVFKTDSVAAKVIAGGDDLDALKLTWDGPEVLAAMAFQGKRGVKLSRGEAGQLIAKTRSKRVRSLVRVDQQYYRYNYRYQHGPKADADRIAKARFSKVIGDRWRVRPASDVTARSGADTVRLVVLCKGAPDAFKMLQRDDESRVGTEHGYVIYELTIPTGD